MSSYSTYYNKVSLCSKSGQTGPIGPTGPRGLLGPQGPPGESTLGNITVGSYNDNDNENNFDLVAYQNVSNILFDENSFIIDVRDNIILDSSTILISLGSSFNSFETWKFDGSNPPLVAQGETSVTFENGKNITIESSNSDSPKLSITAIPELTSTIVDNNKCLKLEELYNFIPTEYPGQDLGSSNYPWSSLYVSRVFALNTIYLGTMSIESTTNGELSINNKSITTIIKENELIIDLSSQVYINESDISKNIINISKNTHDINEIVNFVGGGGGSLISVADLSSQVYINESDISKNIIDIIKNTYDITQLKNLVGGSGSGGEGGDLSSQVYINESDISKNIIDIFKNTDDIFKNTYEINEIKNFVGGSGSLISVADLSSQVYINESDISKNIIDIIKNTYDINQLKNLVDENKSQIVGYIQTQFKNTGFTEYDVTQDLDLVEGYNLTIIPSQPNNNITINIRFSYRTSGQAGEKLRVQIGYNVVALDYHEVICDETMGTLNTSNLEQTFNFNYINKAKSSDPHYYWIKFQKILDSNVENLDLGNDYNTKIFNSFGNLIMLQELIGTNISEITNNMGSSEGTENKYQISGSVCSEGTENKSQISGYIQTQFKNTGFSEYYVPQNLHPVEGYNLTIIPSQPNNNIIINIRFSYRTSGQAGEKLRVQIGYNVVALDYHEVICDETMGTLNTSNLEQTFNFNYINKAKGNYQHYYWIKFQKILHSNVENLDLGNDYNTKILNSVGNLIMLQEVVGTNIYEITNNTVWSQGTENTLSYNLGNIGINTENPTEKLEIDGSVKITGQNSFLNIPSNPPITSNSYGKQGDITWDNNYIYVCVAENSWKRTSFSKDNW